MPVFKIHEQKFNILLVLLKKNYNFLGSNQVFSLLALAKTRISLLSLLFVGDEPIADQLTVFNG